MNRMEPTNENYLEDLIEDHEKKNQAFNLYRGDRLYKAVLLDEWEKDKPLRVVFASNLACSTYLALIPLPENYLEQAIALENKDLIKFHTLDAVNHMLISSTNKELLLNSLTSKYGEYLEGDFSSSYIRDRLGALIRATKTIDPTGPIMSAILKAAEKEIQEMTSLQPKVVEVEPGIKLHLYDSDLGITVSVDDVKVFVLTFTLFGTNALARTLFVKGEPPMLMSKDRGGMWEYIGNFVL